MVSKEKRNEYTQSDILLTEAMALGHFGNRQAFRLRLLGAHCVRVAVNDCLETREHNKPELFQLAPHV